jgi:mannose-6-phosphate isomerase-like protein (cupin superfamily)
MELTYPAKYLKDAGLVRRPEEGIRLGGVRDGTVIKFRSEETGGAYALVETILPPCSGGPPLHVHSREDELFYVLEGALLVQLGERQVTLTAGWVGYAPRGTPHTFCNPWAAPVRLLGFLTPGVFEGFFEDSAAISAATPPGGVPDLAAQLAVGRKYGSVVVGPPLAVPPPPAPDR